MHPARVLFLSPFLLTAPGAARAQPATPDAVLQAAPVSDWTALDPMEMLVLDLTRGGRVVIQLAPEFAPVHVANIRALAHAGWYDGLWISRVQDGYVVQWGDPDGRRPLPAGLTVPAPAEYERTAAGIRARWLPYRDSYAAHVGVELAHGWPVAPAGRRAWLAHCYGMVGVGRDLAPDTGSGAELYAVIGHAPRRLDRNIALVGRVVAGMERLTALPRGSAALGFYATPAERVPIARVRLAADLAAADRPALRMLRPDSASFARWLQVSANRRDAFYIRPAGALDLCNALPPVRRDEPARR